MTGIIPIGTKSGLLLLTPRQAAERLGISERTLWQLKADGEIPFLRIGRLIRYSLVDLEKWVEDRSQGGK